MPIDIIISGDTTFDESLGLQNTGVDNPPVEDNDDDDVPLLATGGTDDLQTDAPDFYARLIALLGGAPDPNPLNTSDPWNLPELNGVSVSDDSFIEISATGNVTGLAWTDEFGADLAGVDSGLDANVNGTIYDVFLYTDTNNNIVLGYAGPNGDDTDTLVYAAYIEEETDAGGYVIDARIWQVFFAPIIHATADPDEATGIDAERLYISGAEELDFDLGTLASGQNDWNWFGDQFDPADPTTGTSYQILLMSDELGQTINTSKGGGNTTIGNSNQLINGTDPLKDADGEAVVFTFAKNSFTALSGADLSLYGDIDYADLQTANTVEWSISQTQGGDPWGEATVTAYLDDDGLKGQLFFDATAEDLEKISIDTVVIKDGGDNILLVAERGVDTAPDGNPDVNVDSTPRTVGKGGNQETFDLEVTFNSDGSFTVQGLRAKDSITYTTPLDHNQVKIQNTGANDSTLAWDIGSFTILDADSEEVDAGLHMKVEDSGPLGTVPALDPVQEDALSNLQSVGNPDDASDTTFVTGSLTGIVPGTDQPAIFALQSATGQAVMSKGEAVEYEVSALIDYSVTPHPDAIITADYYVLYGFVDDTGAGTPESYDPLVDRLIYTFTLDVSGNYVFRLEDQVDHSASGTLAARDDDTLTIDFTDFVMITDFDGDPVTLQANDVQATIENDVPETNGNFSSVDVFEDGLSTAAGDLSDGIGGGATDALGSIAGLVDDGADEDTTFAWASDVTSLNGIWTSNGEPVTWSESGGVLTASAGARVIMTVTLAANGDYDVDLRDQWDHTGLVGDSETLTVDLSGVVEATDADNDTIGLDPNTFKVVIENDVPETNGNFSSVDVFEDGLSTAAGDLSDGIGGGATDALGSIAGLVDDGADEDTTFAWASDVTSLNGIWTSNGEPVTWSESGGVLTASAGARVIMTVTLAANGDYDVDLRDQWDHTGLVGDSETLTVDLSGVVEATDADNDTIGLDPNTFKVVIENDVPETNGNFSSVDVFEDGLSTAAGDLSDGIGGGATDALGSIAGLVDDGADEDTTFAWASDVTSLNGIWTSNGEPVTWSESGGVLTASAGARVIMTVTLAANGDYDVDLRDQWDHTGLVGDSETLTVDLSGVVEATDADNDTIGLDPNTFKVVIENDVPTLAFGNLVGTATDQLQYGYWTSADGADETATLNITAGSTFTIHRGGDDTDTATGDVLSFTYDASTGIGTGTLDADFDDDPITADTQVDFTLTVNSDGSYTFQLDEALSQPTTFSSQDGQLRPGGPDAVQTLDIPDSISPELSVIFIGVDLSGGTVLPVAIFPTLAFDEPTLQTLAGDLASGTENDGDGTFPFINMLSEPNVSESGIGVNNNRLQGADQGGTPHDESFVINPDEPVNSVTIYFDTAGTATYAPGEKLDWVVYNTDGSTSVAGTVNLATDVLVNEEDGNQYFVLDADALSGFSGGDIDAVQLTMDIGVVRILKIDFTTGSELSADNLFLDFSSVLTDADGDQTTSDFSVDLYGRQIGENYDVFMLDADLADGDLTDPSADAFDFDLSNTAATSYLVEGFDTLVDELVFLNATDLATVSTGIDADNDGSFDDSRVEIDGVTVDVLDVTLNPLEDLFIL